MELFNYGFFLGFAKAYKTQVIPYKMLNKLLEQYLYVHIQSILK